MADRQAGFRALAETIARVTEPIVARRGAAAAAIMSEWPAVVGERLAAVSQPERIVFPPGGRRDGSLRLRVASGAVALSLQHLAPVILDKVNTFYGYRAVSRLHMVQAPLLANPAADERSRREVPSPSPPTASEDQGRLGYLVATIDDDRLRAILSRLGRRMTADSSQPSATHLGDGDVDAP
jgi:hypothetical protein